MTRFNAPSGDKLLKDLLAELDRPMHWYINLKRNADIGPALAEHTVKIGKSLMLSSAGAALLREADAAQKAGKGGAELVMALREGGFMQVSPPPVGIQEAFEFKTRIKALESDLASSRKNEKMLFNEVTKCREERGKLIDSNDRLTLENSRLQREVEVLRGKIKEPG